jgi:hypothetical protein
VDKDRFYAYTGEGMNSLIPKNYCSSLKFISQYDSGLGIQYTKVIKNIPLVLLPYLSTGIGGEKEIKYFIKILNYLLNYINVNFKILKSKLPKPYNSYTIHSMYYCLLKFFGVDLELYNDDITNDVYSEDEIVSYNSFIELMNEVENKVPISVKTVNYDYFVSNIFCSLGSIGWIRVSSFDTSIMGDEVHFCNISKLYKYIIDTNECNLTSKCV